MSPTNRRAFSHSPDFDAKLDFYFGSDDDGVAVAGEFLTREVIRYVHPTMAELWPELPPVIPGEEGSRYRFFAYHGDLIDRAVILARLDAVEIDENGIVEHITLYDLSIIDEAEPLEDPDDPTSDR